MCPGPRRLGLCPGSLTSVPGLASGAEEGQRREEGAQPGSHHGAEAALNRLESRLPAPAHGTLGKKTLQIPAFKNHLYDS